MEYLNARLPPISLDTDIHTNESCRFGGRRQTRVFAWNIVAVSPNCFTMIYDVNSHLFRSFLSQKGGGAYDKRYAMILLSLCLQLETYLWRYVFVVVVMWFVNLIFSLFCNCLFV